MQCVHFQLLPSAVHARSSKQHILPNTPSPTIQANSSNTNLQRSRTLSPSTFNDRRAPVLRATMQDAAVQTIQQANAKTLLCTSVTARTFDQAITEIQQIAEAGADLIELRLDMLTDFVVEQHLQQLLATTNVPKVVTMRPVWEGSAFGILCAGHNYGHSSNIPSRPLALQRQVRWSRTPAASSPQVCCNFGSFTC